MLVSAETRSRDRAVALREELTARLAEIDAAASNMAMEQDRAASVIRNHWAIENRNH
jgi:predicted transposase YbfD/YdcC